ncbi:IS3 family transposase [Nocardia farcinica]|uniref:IS3 family transposase n=1 Tax=Nocardia farcinica TaxID=37329 RepID=UPI003D78E17F
MRAREGKVSTARSYSTPTPGGSSAGPSTRPRPQRWKPLMELANAIFEYLEIFHNRCRRHSALGMRTPIEYEMMQPSIHPVA